MSFVDTRIRGLKKAYVPMGVTVFIRIFSAFAPSGSQRHHHHVPMGVTCAASILRMIRLSIQDIFKVNDDDFHHRPAREEARESRAKALPNRLSTSSPASIAAMTTI